MYDLQVVWLSPGHHRLLDLVQPEPAKAAMPPLTLATLVGHTPPQHTNRKKCPQQQSATDMSIPGELIQCRTTQRNGRMTVLPYMACVAPQMRCGTSQHFLGVNIPLHALFNILAAYACKATLDEPAAALHHVTQQQ